MDGKDLPVLVMDDEDLIRDMTTLMLEQLRFKVTTCSNGKEATEHYRKAMDSRTPFFATIVDIDVAGGMGGVEAAKEILDFDPGAKLIVCSSYQEHDAMASPTKYGFRAALAKPYSLAALAAVLQELL